ncbi:hypothetical protein DESUT3_29510 [Desulfuromonas versatilis]|uniref:Ysc84 actin-binding domain-containing protein n=1 Tax=Desulfuromonas versatilis TaxID=2802975 RepID=A0ABM8HXP6_9BACT|nr:lipid-binding SYLF domain-containing protein [Desulfuromonas versatilis]BCR05882.1 hypothetical protein DESUT3_29510 [Desulfuromonas versatilis]
MMKKVFGSTLLALALLCAALLPAPAEARLAEPQKLRDVIEVLDQAVGIPESGIPPRLLTNAYGVVIIPGAIKVGVVLGGRYGKGVVLVRGPAGDWSHPAFVSLTGGSLGLQIGAQSTDVILVFKTRRSIEGLLEGKITLGADAAVSAGPVGRQVEGATDGRLAAEIYSYSRSRGLFAGVSLAGAVLQIDQEANREFYRRSNVQPRMLLDGEGLPRYPEVDQLRARLRRFAPAVAD